MVALLPRVVWLYSYSVNKTHYQEILSISVAFSWNKRKQVDRPISPPHVQLRIRELWILSATFYHLRTFKYGTLDALCISLALRDLSQSQWWCV